VASSSWQILDFFNKYKQFLARFLSRFLYPHIWIQSKPVFQACKKAKNFLFEIENDISFLNIRQKDVSFGYVKG